MESEAGFYCVIPTVVLNRESLSDSEKLVAVVITALVDTDGICRAKPEEIGRELGYTADKVVNCVSALESHGLIAWRDGGFIASYMV